MATKKARKSKKKTGRASPEAIEKRRAARALNTALTEATGSKLDKRTERRRQRLLDELKSGKRGKRDMKPTDALTHAQALLDMGEGVTAIKKAAGRKYRAPKVTEEVREVARQTQAAYGFDERVWSVVGIKLGKQAPKRKRAAKKK